jgi:hypothetical protein
MADRIQLRNTTEANKGSAIMKEREPLYITDEKELYIKNADGSLTPIGGAVTEAKKADVGYADGGVLLGKTELVSGTQYLAGDGLWYRLKLSTTSPYTHDASDTPDLDYLEIATLKNTADTVDNLSQDVKAIVILTQSEYDALGAEKLTNNTLYVIKE